MPQLEDPNFHRAVVLLVHHDGDGAFGLVVNRSADLTIGDLCASLEIPWAGDTEVDVGLGGPVQPNTGWLLFDASADEDLPDSREVMPGIQFAGSVESLRHLADAPPERVRMFLGYAGWGPGQLESELVQGAWLLAPATPELVFEVAWDELWERAVRGLGVEPTHLIPTPGLH